MPLEKIVQRHFWDTAAAPTERTAAEQPKQAGITVISEFLCAPFHN